MSLNSDDLEHINKYLIEPLSGRLDVHQRNIEEMFRDLKQSFRMVLDPTTGFVPRSELTLAFEREERLRAELWGAVNATKEAVNDISEKLAVPMVTREEMAKRDLAMVKWIVGTGISVGMLIVGALAAMHAFWGVH